MTRRHDALIPLSHDHHHALRMCRLLRTAAGGTLEERSSAARDFVAFFRDHSVAHFREEEEGIFPLVWARSGAPTDAIVRILAEHVHIHALVRTLERELDASSADPETMSALADLLRAHVRFEEDVVFPAIERIAPDELAAVELRARERSSVQQRPS